MYRKALTRSVVPLGAARAAVGLIVFAKPEILAHGLGLDSGTAERTAWIARMFAGRDLALGVGAAAGSRGCQVAACAGDVVDAVALGLAIRSRSVKTLPAALTVLTAAGGALIGAAGLSLPRT